MNDPLLSETSREIGASTCVKCHELKWYLAQAAVALGRTEKVRKTGFLLSVDTN
jgi:hypothetical protein